MTITDTLAVRLYGWTREEAHAAGACIRCHAAIDYNDLEPIDRKEYDLSAFCGGCFDAVMADVKGEEE